MGTRHSIGRGMVGGKSTPNEDQNSRKDAAGLPKEHRSESMGIPWTTSSGGSWGGGGVEVGQSSVSKVRGDNHVKGMGPQINRYLLSKVRKREGGND